MTSPRRIQQKREKGWRKPAGAVSVARPSRWGNPYTVETFRDGVGDTSARVRVPEDDRTEFFYAAPWEIPTKEQAAAYAVELYRTRWIPLADMSALRKALRGKDLMCWCPLDQPCHADVLLEIANKENPR